MNNGTKWSGSFSNTQTDSSTLSVVRYQNRTGFNENSEMNFRKLSNIVVAFLFFGCFAFGILSIMIGSLSSLDRNITKIQIVIVDEPKFYFSGLDQPSFYSFSGEGYNCDFRIADETLDVLEENNEIREQVKSIKFGDTVDVFIQTFEIEKLQKRKNVHIIGLSQNNKVVIHPAKVFESDKRGVKTSAFLFSICGIGIAVWLIRKYTKAKAQHTTAGLAQAVGDRTQRRQQ